MKTLPKLTRKQQVFVDELVANPKQPATEAAQKAYNVKARTVASALAVENLRKPSILAHLHNASDTAELTLIDVLSYSREYGRAGGKGGAAYAAVAGGVANSLLDRVHGKATQRMEVSSTALVFSIDLSGASLPNDDTEEAKA